MWRQAVGLLPGLALAGNLFAAMSAMADGGGATFRVGVGHLSENVRALAHSHGWSLEWGSEEDRIIAHTFDMANPSLEAALSNILAPYESTFSTSLDQERKVVRVTATDSGAPEEGAPDPEGEEGLRWSTELDFEPDLESTVPPEPPPFEGEKKTVRMLDLPQAWESERAEPMRPAQAEVTEQQTPVVELSPKQEAQGARAPEPSEDPADSPDRVVSAEKAGAAPEKPGTASGPASPGPVLQILSAKDKGKAEKELARLRGLGHDVFLEEFHHDGTLWHRLKVRIAPNRSIEDAVEDLKRLGYEAVWVVSQGAVKNQPHSRPLK